MPLQLRARVAEHLEKRWPRQSVELLLGAVKIVDVDCRDSQIPAAPLHLIRDIPGSETVASRDDVGRIHYAGAEVFGVEKIPVTLAGRRRRKLQRDISALAANDDLIPLNGAIGQ